MSRMLNVIDELMNGKGFFLLKKAFSKDVVEMARVAVNQMPAIVETYPKHSAGHDIKYKLLGNGEIFEKVATHPATLEISRAILGPLCRISVFDALTVHPGMTRQLPHMDYPYYDRFWPTSNMHVDTPLNIGFMTMITKFTKENGATAFLAGSQKCSKYPIDVDEFYQNMVQGEGEAGDILVYRGNIQHCAMGNTSDSPRVGILQQMVPVYVQTNRDMTLPAEQLPDLSVDMRKILAVDHPHPM